MCHFKIHKKKSKLFDCVEVTNNSIMIRNQSTCGKWLTLDTYPRFFEALIINYLNSTQIIVVTFGTYKTKECGGLGTLPSQTIYSIGNRIKTISNSIVPVEPIPFSVYQAYIGISYQVPKKHIL